METKYKHTPSMVLPNGKLTRSMKTYELYIKSCAEAPDLEDEVEATSKSEAARYFAGRHRGEGGENLGREWFMQFIAEE